MKYWVSFKVEGRYITAVDANNAEDAIQKANDEYVDADFGSLQDIEAEPIIV